MDSLQQVEKPEVIVPVGKSLRRDQIMRFAPFAILLLVIVFLGLNVKDFFTPQNLINVLMQAAPLGLMATGMAVAMITGGIDLSIPAVMAFSGIIGAMYLRDGGSPVVAAFLIVAVGLVGGCINGVAIAYLRMIPFVVTLSMMAIASGASVGVTNAKSIGLEVKSPFVNAILTRIGTIPLPVILLFVIMLIVQLFLVRSLFGRWLYAVGTNIRAARVSGIPTRRVIFLAYAFSGMMTGLAGVVITAQQGAAAATIGQSGVVLDVVSSAVLGGVSIYGGVGSALSAVIGAILITLITNSMNLMNVSYFLSLVVKGIVIIAVVALTTSRKR